VASAQPLTPDEREALLDAAARACPSESVARSVLRPLGLRMERLPTWLGTRAEYWWAEVFEEFDNGIIDDPYPRLLASLLDRFPANPVFLRLSARLSAVPAPERAGGRIFLCHALEDKPAARDLYDKLRADGLNPWIDDRDIPPGTDWNAEIRRVIRHSDYFLALISTESVNKRGYAQREIVRALSTAEEMPEGKAFIIPVRLDDCQVPDRLATWQYVNLFEPDGYPRLRETLVAR
jgi:TIR domain/Effector-associated domain 1